MIEKIRKLLFSPLVLVLFLSLPAFWSLLRPGYFPMHDDMQAMRLHQMDKCVKDGQIPCRWVPDMGYGYGYPQFNYYAPTPYYIMELFHLGGLGILDSVKAVFVLSVVLSGVGMYLLGTSLWGRLGGVVSALFYVYAPYRAVDMYVRGAVGEFWALAALPFIFLAAKGVVEGQKKAILWLALSLALLLTSHNITSMIFIPALVAWIGFLILRDKKLLIPQLKGILKNVFFGAVWGVTISAFFSFPAWIERGYVHIESLLGGYFNYLAHFVSFGQLLFSSYWGFGGSELGPNDELFLGVGILYWTIPLLTIALLALAKKKKEVMLLSFFVLLGFLALFMTHQKSAFLWERIGILSYLQFPWRFLVIATFAFSVACGAISRFVSGGRQKILVTGLFVILILFYGSFFKPERWLDLSDQEKFSGDNWERQQTISIFDYLPKVAKAPPGVKASEEPIILEGSAKVIEGEKGSDWQGWKISVESDSSRISLPIYYFPGWEVTSNGSKVSAKPEGDLGLISFSLNKGENSVYANLRDTQVRAVSNWVTVGGILAIVPFLGRRKKK